MVFTSSYIYKCTKCSADIVEPEDAIVYKEFQICANCYRKAFPSE